MEIHKIVLGPLDTNCYVLYDKKTLDACIIDPGYEANKIKAFISKNKLNAKFIINTHGHIDHISADGAFEIPIYIHKLEVDFLKNPSKNLSQFFGVDIILNNKIIPLNDGDIINIGSETLQVIHTPGHTPGGISLKGNGYVFTGDTLFCGSIGRTDFPLSSEKDIFDSIKNKLFKLDDNTIVYPGHGPDCTIGNERDTNPFIDPTI